MTTFMRQEDVKRLAKSRQCPRCDFDKTFGVAICKSCRVKLPEHMRLGLVAIENKDPGFVARAIRQAANFFDVHFQSVRNFGGGKKR
jgi:hypothetical protein